MELSVRHRWRYYRAPGGRKPVRDFIESLAGEDSAEVFAAMREVREVGLRAARHLRSDLYEARADGQGGSFRILFAHEGAKGRVLLALVGFEKKNRQTPHRFIDLAESRLRDWRSRAR